MKRWFDYSDEELLAIYNGEADVSYETLVDLECAYAGAPLPPENPGPKPTSEIPEKDVTLYKIGGIYLGSMEDAEQLYNLLVTMDIWSSQYHSVEYYAKKMKMGEYGFPEIQAEKLYSKAVHESVVEDVKLSNQQQNEWQVRKDAYDEAVSKRSNIADKIHEKIQQIAAEQYRRERMEEQMAQYLELAEGDRDIALNFLEKAHPSYKEEFPEFFERETQEG